MQKCECKNWIGERNIWNEILDNAGAARDKGDKRKVERFFFIRGIFLRDGMLDAEEHRCKNVKEVQSNKEWHESFELERRRVAVVCKSINADADANKYADDAWRRK